MKITKLQKTPLSNVDEIAYKPIQIYYGIFKDKLFYLVIFLIIILLIILKIWRLN